MKTNNGVYTSGRRNTGTTAPLPSSRSRRNNMPGIGRWLKENKLGVDMGVRATSGFCTYPLYTLL